MNSATPGFSKLAFSISALLACLSTASTHAGIFASGDYNPSPYGSWTTSTNIIIGQSGNGSLNVSNSSVLSIASANIGRDLSATGTVTLSSGGTLNSSGTFNVGNVGIGTLNVQSASELYTTFSFIAANSSGPAYASTATITGNGSLWNNSNTLYVGGNGNGQLNILSGATVTVGTSGASGDLKIADQATSTSTVSVNGFNATLVVDNGMDVGYRGNGTLEVLNGGSVTTSTTFGTAFIGRYNNSTGQVTVNGNGSSWVTSSGIAVGNSDNISGGANGTLTIENNGLVEAKNVHIPETYGTLNINTGGLLRINGGSLSGITDLTGLNVEFVGGASGSYTNLTIDNGLNVSDGSTIAVSGTLGVTGAGVLGGNGQITGNVDNAGTVGPGNSPGILTIDGNYEQDAAGTLAIELNGTTPGTEHDPLVITGNATLDGTLDVSLLFGFDLEEAMEFEIMDIAGTRTGTFDGLNQGAKFGDYDGLQLQIDYAGGDGNDVVLTVVPEPTSLVPLALGGLLLIRRRR